MTLRTRAARAGLLVAVTLASTACLIGPNPDFIDPNAEETGDESGAESGMCPAGTLDCDDEPGCEADANDPSTCGSCAKICELGGQPLECEAGQCVGTAVFTELADTYVDAEQSTVNFGSEPSLLVDQSRTTYIALPDVAQLPGNVTLEHVGLYITCITCTQAGVSLQLQRVEPEWDEQQVTAATAPSGSEEIGSFDFVLGDNVVELAGMLPSWRSGAPTRSIRISATGPEPTPVELSSREGGDAPYLVITLSY